ncbi:aquaporin-7 isoform X2 [Nothobranchius furzeri]|uniref:Transcript variant X2 n=1 Tax=Nothobranchius furzeri TaxID=105023 RepID=A0A9D2XU26_NOTFU|nr:aquaporin-7 isoform X2 [Nothobranchius furzeri]KAF7208290.1 transcript variant X2 [Nothobranchius furzeri]
MKDLVRSVEQGVSHRRRVDITRPKVWLKNELSRVGLAEFLCTYVMMVLGLGCVAQVVTGQGAFGHYISINIGFGLAVAMGVHIGGNVSEAVNDYCGGNLTVTGAKATAGIFATYPAPYLSLMGGFVDQVIGTAMLLLCLMALSDQKNKPAVGSSEPLTVGLVVVLIGMSLGSNSGYAINPTRDIAPRVFTAIAGWGLDVFRSGNGWWWVPLVAPPIGGVLGAGLYKAFVELHHPPISGQQENSIPLKKGENICTNV